MASRPSKVSLKGSERKPLAGARAVGPVAPDHRIEVTVVVRRRPASPGLASLAEASAVPPRKRKYISRKDFAADHGADPADLAKVEQFARDNHLVLVDASLPRRTVLLSGRVEDFNQAFGTKLEHYEHPEGTYRGRTGPLQIPADLADVVVAVLGLDNRTQAKPHFQRLNKPGGAAQAHAAGSSFTPVQVAKLYDFPTGVDGQGECIAIIELGGGFRPADLKTYFQQLGVPLPQVIAVSVDSAKNQPTGDPNGADGEVMLDIEVAGAVAPKAKVVVYFAPNTDQGYLDAFTTAIHDTQNNPSVISTSWGSPESSWTPQAMEAFTQVFQDAAALGVTVCAASGDQGSGDGAGDGLAHVDFPASSPFALGCGGTRLQASGTGIGGEVVWDDDPATSASGGGVSDQFPLPDYQKNAHVPPSANPGQHVGRGVPDVAGDADPETGYQVRVDGIDTVIGGTSAVAPLWAGLIALLNQRLGAPVGFLNPILYAKLGGTAAFHDITSGTNGAYAAGPGWDACTGWGSPDGNQLVNGIGG